MRLRRVAWLVSIAVLVVAWLVPQLATPVRADEKSWASAIESGNAAYQKKNYSRALRELTAALKDARGFSKGGDEVAATLNSLGLVYDALNLHAKARACFREAIRIRKRKHGKYHQSLVSLTNNLASSYLLDKEYQEAANLLEQSNRIIEKAEGKDSAKLSVNLNRLAKIYRMLKRYDQAESVLRRSLGLARKSFGADSSAIAVIQNNLAVILRLKGDKREAEGLYENSLEIRKKIFGKNTLEVASSLNNLARSYREQNKFEEAEALLKRSLKIVETAAGATTQQHVAALKNLAYLYRELGKPQKAEPYYKKALAVQKRDSGKADESLTDTLLCMGEMYRELGKLKTARRKLQEALKICSASGASQYERLRILNQLEETYRQESDIASAISVNEKERRIIREQDDYDREMMARKLNDAALLYGEQNKLSRSEKFLEEALAEEERSMKGSIASATYMNNLARIRLRQGKYEAALELLARVIAIRTKVLGEESLPVAAAYRNYALVLREMKRDKEADRYDDRAEKIEVVDDE